MAWRAAWPGLEELPNVEPRNGIGFASSYLGMFVDGKYSCPENGAIQLSTHSYCDRSYGLSRDFPASPFGRCVICHLHTMSKLSPTLKSLINAAHSRPGPVPAPPRIQALYKRIQEEATDRKLGRPSWLGISTAATMTMNSPESMIALYNSSTTSEPESERIATAEFMREIGLKCIGFNGVRHPPHNEGASCAKTLYRSHARSTC